MNVSSRHHLRNDEIERLQTVLIDKLGIDPPNGRYELVELDHDMFDLILIDARPLCCYIHDDLFVTVKGANVLSPNKGRVIVDSGAVSFVSDGADIMRPGIVDTDQNISSDDLVVIQEEQHHKSLAIGRAKVAGEEMIGDHGKVIENIHHVGDKLYQFEI
ncbi:MAG: RNA-binding protein [Halobacteriaceae archaeon]